MQFEVQKCVIDKSDINVQMVEKRQNISSGGIEDTDGCTKPQNATVCLQLSI